LKWAGVIPIDKTGGLRSIVQSLRLASDALKRGELVCIFAEGRFTRTGFLLPFQRGFEQIVKRSPAPIIPVYLDHLWGSIFSFQNQRFLWKLPKQIPYPVYISFGPALPATASPFEVRQVVQKMSAESAIRRAPKRRPVHRQFVRMACRHPLRPCLIDPADEKKPILNYGETLAAAKVFTKLLRPLLRDEHMVGVWMPPTRAGAMANIALAFLGKVSVNLNYSATNEVVRSSIKQCGIRKILTARPFLHKAKLDPGPDVEFIYLEDFRKQITTFQRLRAYLSVLLLPGWIQERWILGLGGHKTDDVATIIFSSGSTGEPKGVVLTHGNIAANAESVVQAIDPVAKDRVLGILPFFHSFGYTVTLWVPLQIGASTAYWPNPLQPKEIGEVCKKYQCTIFLSTPTFLRSFLRRCDAGDFASIRLLVVGAEKMPLSLAKEFNDKFGVMPLEGYGCTELSPVACVNAPNFQQGNISQIGNKPGTIGQPLPGTAAKIVHRETLQPVPCGEEGLLLITGANVMKGYLGKDDLTKQKIIDGWYVTGDLANLDDEGFVTITGREERFAKVGGEMVPLEKVEDELHAIVDSGGERICAVTAIPDDKKGERIVVLHLPLPNGLTTQQWWKQLNERGLPNIYVPSPRDFYQVTELPMLGSGKLDLKKCKAQALELAAGSKLAV
jgi:acyl-[acyl-carrier-protein]-phospholipid O-acyltransferase/long-chain-fatty-acid--[acyl-carrier-protein] ligase